MARKVRRVQVRNVPMSAVGFDYLVIGNLYRVRFAKPIPGDPELPADFPTNAKAQWTGSGWWVLTPVGGQVTWYLSADAAAEVWPLTQFTLQDLPKDLEYMNQDQLQEVRNLLDEEIEWRKEGRLRLAEKWVREQGKEVGYSDPR